MGTRSLVLAAGVLLVASPARAHEHPNECLGTYGFSTKDLRLISLSCSTSTYYGLSSEPPPPPPPAPAGEQQTQDDRGEGGPLKPPSESKWENKWFMVLPDIVRFYGSIDGRDFTRDLVTAGARFTRPLGTERVIGYVQLTAGLARTEREGDAEDKGLAIVGGAGVDFPFWTGENGHERIVVRLGVGTLHTFGAGEPETLSYFSPSLGLRFGF